MLQDEPLSEWRADCFYFKSNLDNDDDYSCNKGAVTFALNDNDSDDDNNNNDNSNDDNNDRYIRRQDRQYEIRLVIILSINGDRMALWYSAWLVT